MIEIPNNISDDELVILLKDKKTQDDAFEFLVRNYSGRLYNVIRRIVLFHEDADDVLQETFYKVWKNIGKFKGRSKLSTWMYSIATNEALSHLRSEKYDRKVPMETSEYDLTEILYGDPFFDGDKAQAALMAAIAKLPDQQKLVFQYRYFDEMPYKEISDITGTSVGALKANFHHAQKKLKSFLGIDI